MPFDILYLLLYFCILFFSRSAYFSNKLSYKTQNKEKQLKFDFFNGNEP